MTTRRVAAGALAGALALGALGFVASANHVSLEDQNDTRGLLDVRRVQLHGSERPRWKVITWAGWTTAETWDAGYVTVLLDTIGDERPDYYVLAGSAGNRMYGQLWRDRSNKRDRRLGPVKVWRPNRTSVSIRLPLRKLNVGERRAFYRWRIETLFTGDRCRRTCFDLAPNDGYVVQPLGDPTPDPVPTITITPTITPQPTPSSSA